MKMQCLAVVAALGMGAAMANGAIIAQWNFETNTPSDVTDNVFGPIVAAEVGSGTLNGVHASNATDWTTPAGPASANSYSSNNWAVGDYIAFSGSTTGLEDIVVSFDATGSNTGPRDFKIAYSTDGATFTDFANYSLINASWSSSGTFENPAAAHFEFDFSSITALNDSGTNFFRLINTSTTAINSVNPVATTGTSRVDNVTISGTPVPEPASLAVLGLGGLAMFARRRRA